MTRFDIPLISAELDSLAESLAPMIDASPDGRPEGFSPEDVHQLLLDASEALREQTADVHGLRTYIRTGELLLARTLASVSAQPLDGSAFDPDGSYVYALWGTDVGKPLYIGQSENILARLGQHLGDRKKRAHVRRVTLVRCESYGVMMRVEATLIAHYQPEWNTVGIRAEWEVRQEELAESTFQAREFARIAQIAMAAPRKARRPAREPATP